MGVPPVKNGPHPFLFFEDRPKAVLYGRDAILQWKSCALLPNREWNQRQKPKKQPWSNVECFAFVGATVRFASLETSFHAANHTIPPPPSYEGLPHCTKDKNRSPFHGEKPLMITWFLFKFKCKLNHTKGEVLLACFQCVDTLLFASKHAKGMSLRYDAILALSDNLISEDWFFAEGECFLCFLFQCRQYFLCGGICEMGIFLGR